MGELDKLLEKDNTEEVHGILQETKEFLTQRSIAID
jgi:hypothetical protein